MQSYRSRSGKASGVSGYSISERSIQVQFYGATYEYTHASAGSSAVENMKQLATSQMGLSTFIAQNKPQFDKKF